MAVVLEKQRIVLRFEDTVLTTGRYSRSVLDELNLEVFGGDLFLFRLARSEQTSAFADVCAGIIQPLRGAVYCLGKNWQELRPDMANALRALGRDDGAIRHFRLAIEANPDYAEAHTNLGVILLRRGETRNAIGQFRAAIDAKPDDARAYYNLGLALEKDGDSEAARSAFEQALKLDPRLQESNSGDPSQK